MARRRLGGAAKAVSQLVRPRIHFGGTFETNVGTANNDDVLDRPDVVDAATVTVHPPEHMGDEEFRRWMEGQTTSGGPGRLRAGWNYYGDNRCSCVDVSVTRRSPSATGRGTRSPTRQSAAWWERWACGSRASWPPWRWAGCWWRQGARWAASSRSRWARPSPAWTRTPTA